jgi:alanine racemase
MPVHIEIETGMNRLGFSVDDIQILIGKLANFFFKIQSVFSHLLPVKKSNRIYLPGNRHHYFWKQLISCRRHLTIFF